MYIHRATQQELQAISLAFPEVLRMRLITQAFAPEQAQRFDSLLEELFMLCLALVRAGPKLAAEVRDRTAHLALLHLGSDEELPGVVHFLPEEFHGETKDQREMQVLRQISRQATCKGLPRDAALLQGLVHDAMIRLEFRLSADRRQTRLCEALKKAIAHAEEQLSISGAADYVRRIDGRSNTTGPSTGH